MAFSRDDDQVTRLSHIHGVFNSLSSIPNTPVILPLLPARRIASCGDLSHDSAKAFRAGVLRRDHHEISQLPGDPAHGRSFLSVPQPGTAEDHDNLP